MKTNRKDATWCAREGAGRRVVAPGVDEGTGILCFSIQRGRLSWGKGILRFDASLSHETSSIVW